MSSVLTEHLSGPSAWRGRDLQGSTEWIYTVSQQALDELDGALAHARSSGRPLEQLQKSDFPLPTFAADLSAIAAELEQGRGFVQMKGLDVDRYGAENAAIVYWGIGLHLGIALSQNARGELLGHVRDEGLDVNDTAVRGYQTNADQSFHTDIGGDVVGLMCVNTAKSGGRSRVVSSIAIHNELLARYPWYLGLLYNGFDIDWRGEEPEGAAPTYREPIFSYHEQRLSCRFAPRFIKSACSKTGIPLSAPAQEAIAIVEELAEELCFEIPFERGDVQLINNYVMLHARTGYVDHADLARRRHLLRLWLKVPGARSLPPEYGGGRAGSGVPVRRQARASS